MRSLFTKWCVVLAVSSFLCLSAMGIASAQEIKGPIKIIVPYPPGGGSDVAARLIADKMKDLVGQTVIVENKPGAGGRIGTEYAKSQPADGTTLLVVNPALFVVSPVVFSKLPYDPDADFVPVSLITTYQFCLSVPATSAIKDVKGLMEWMKQNPKQANYGSPAAGSLPHFFGLMVSKAAGVEMVHSSYNGSGPLVTALIGGQIPMGIDAYDAQSTYHPDKIRILATAGTNRKNPQIPTFIELGYKDIEGVGWNAMVAPAKTPKPIVDKLSAAIVKAVKMPDVVEKIEKLGNDAVGTTPEAFAAILKKDRERWVPIIKASGFKAE
ncbi:MAG: Bug family tripartite tricarboxylate transporter substrate binding protein [Desulfobacterota bacterium]|jgi:tripartite-type tricarboxylate transporter receptor subunit TctC|nr:Bug family tripartite tricarboxylate transporter substrate binding protein [Thermodesulfobacteriota bacterium]